MKIVGVMPLIVIPATIGLLAAVTVALTSKNDHHPRYHFVSCTLYNVFINDVMHDYVMIM